MVTDIGGIPMVQAGGYGGYGDCGMGGSGIWAILLLALLGRRGFDGEGHEGHGDCGRCCEKELDLMNTTMNSRFNETNMAIDHNADLAFQQTLFKEICDTNANLSNQIAQGSFANAMAAKDNTIELLECCCKTNKNIDDLRFNTAQEACGINKNVDQLRFDDALGFCNTQKQLSDCCCKLERGQDQIRFEAAQNTCAIMANDTANAQKIIDKMTCNEIQELRDKLQDQRFENSQLMQNAFLVNQLKPCPVPAYPSCNPWGCNSFGFDGFNRFDGRRDGFRDGGCCGCI